VQIGRRRRGYGLALAREEQRRVLQRESLYVYLVPTPLKVRAMISMIEPVRPGTGAQGLKS